MERSARQEVSAALAAASQVAAIVLLALLIAGRVFYRGLGLPRDFGWDRIAVIAIALGLILLARLSRTWNPRPVLVLLTSLVLAGLGLLVLPAAHVDVSDIIRQRLIRLVYRPHAATRIIQRDDRYGYVYAPNSEDFERTADYSVTYTIDAAGDRVMPSPSAETSRAVFLGDSFTFGQGVENDQTFLAVLARGPWHNVRLLNKAVAGWGLTQMYLRLLDQLKQPPAPTAVVAVIVANDLRRSHLRPPLVAGQSRRLEFINGAFVSTDLDYGRQVSETRALLDEESKVATDILLRMNLACRERHAAFAIMLLHTDPFPPGLTYALGAAAIPLLDLTGLKLVKSPVRCAS